MKILQNYANHMKSKNTGEQEFIKDFINMQGLNNPGGLGKFTPQGERVFD